MNYPYDSGSGYASRTVRVPSNDFPSDDSGLKCLKSVWGTKVKEKHSKATWQANFSLHMYHSEDAKRPLAHATLNCKNSIQQFETNRVRTLSHRVIPLDHYDFLRWKRFFAQSIYSLKLDISHSSPSNFREDKTVYMTTHIHSQNTWMSSEALRIALIRVSRPHGRPWSTASAEIAPPREPKRLILNLGLLCCWRGAATSVDNLVLARPVRALFHVYELKICVWYNAWETWLVPWKLKKRSLCWELCIPIVHFWFGEATKISILSNDQTCHPCNVGSKDETSIWIRVVLQCESPLSPLLAACLWSRMLTWFQLFSISLFFLGAEFYNL